MKKFLILSALVSFLMVFSLSANASMSSFYTYTGEGAGISIDALGTADTGTIQAEIPASAVIQAAYLYSASVWSTSLYDVDFAGDTLTSDASSKLDIGAKDANPAAENRWDVTSLVQSGYNTTGGIFDFDVKENGYLDGEILAVVYGVQGEDVQTAMIFDGELATDGDTFNISLSPAYDGTSDAIFSLGISYGYQASNNPPSQYTTIDINGTRLTSSAGGEDDGYSGNGGLITAGGVGDSLLGPADPNSHGTGYGYDDELYNLKGILAAGDNSIGITTLNPSNDDNVFFAALTVKGKADPHPAVPEPGTILLFGIGMAGLAIFRKKIARG